MAIFFHSRQKAYALVSFKALYSRFTAASTWDEIAVDSTPRLMCKAILNGGIFLTYFLIRSPYDRTVSCFLDKYRKQPKRIDAGGFEWQHCHQVLYPHLQIAEHDPHEEIAARFLAFTFDQFIDILPEIYTLDGHFKPQYWTARVLVGSNRSIRWPLYRLVPIEDSESLWQIPGIDFSTKTNTTEHIERDFSLEERHKSVIRSVYRRDFLLGGYSA